MYYVTYLSKPRTRLGISQEEMEAEYKYNRGRRVTKVLPTINDVKQFDNFGKVYTKIISKIANTCNLLDIPFARTALLPTTVFTPFYETFRIPKASGGVREITAPTDKLKDLQRDLLDILTNDCKMLPHNAAHGFTKERNPKTALEVHQANKSRWFLKMDIKDFFPSCTAGLVVYALSSVYPTCHYPDHVIYNIATIATREEVLPQGSPLSPMIANLIMLPIDEHLTNYCREHKLKYTRYADDMLISSREKFNYEEVVAYVSAALRTKGFTLHPDKVRFGSSAGRNWNLGLMYNEEGNITVGYKKKKLVKTMIHNFTTKPEEQTPENKAKLLGVVGYCMFIEPEYFRPYLQKVQSIQV